MKRTLIMLSLLLAPGSAHSAEKFDTCIRMLCTSTSQTNCWIKAAAAMCDRDQIGCRELPDAASAKVLRKEGRRYEVLTIYGKGWVSDRMMMVDGGACPG